MAHYGRKRQREDYDDGSPRYFKRGRYSDPGPRGREPESAEQKLESLITRVGEKSHKSLESNLEALSHIVYKEISTFKDKILRTICNCVGSLSEKTSIYSTLVGILNAKNYDFGEEFLDMLVEDLKGSLALKQFEKARQLVRFLADLVNAKVVQSSSLMNLFDTFITVTYEPDIPQVRSDWYVYMTLSSLPWVGSELQERKRTELERLFTAVDNYMSKRTTPYLPAFQVWTSDHPHPQRDHLELLWSQIKKMRDGDWKASPDMQYGKWRRPGYEAKSKKEHILLRPYIAFDSEIGGAYSHPLPTLHVPNHTEDSLYPLPLATFRIFDNSNLQFAPSGSELPLVESIDRYLAEEMVRCILHSHENNRKECANALIMFAERMNRRLPTEYIITEVLFAHILQLPSPPQVVVYYASVFIELCKSNPAAFPQILSQTTELLYTRLDKMNTICINRLARWFAYHLSNFKYQWDWNMWSSCFQGPPDHAAVRFICEVFSRCVRLAYYEEFVEMIQEPFTDLLPPDPTPQFKYSTEVESPLPESQVASQLLDSIRAKDSFDKMTTILDSLTTLDPDLAQNRDRLIEAKVELLMQCVLNIGSKTISHCVLALYKFRQLFTDLARTDQSKMACLRAVAEFYAHNTQWHTLVIDKLVRMQIVDCMTVINWLFSSEVVPQFTRQYSWDILESTIQKTNKAHLQSVRDLADAKEKLKKVSDLDEVAMGGEERQELEGKVDELEEKVEESERTLKDVFLTVCQRLIGILSQHLSHCDQEGVDYETAWFLCTLDNCRQLLMQNYSELLKYSTSLETLAFTADVDSRILEVFQQFQALL